MISLSPETSLQTEINEVFQRHNTYCQSIAHMGQYTGHVESRKSRVTVPVPLQFPHKIPPSLGSPAGTTRAPGGGIARYPFGITVTYPVSSFCDPRITFAVCRPNILAQVPQGDPIRFVSRIMTLWTKISKGVLKGCTIWPCERGDGIASRGRRTHRTHRRTCPG